MFRKKLFMVVISLIMVSAFIPFASFAGNTDETVVNSTAGSTEEGTQLESGPNLQISENSQNQNVEPETEPTDPTEPETEPTDSTEPETKPTDPTEPPQKEDTIMSSAKTTKGKSVRSTAGAVAAEPGYELTVVGQQQAPLSPGVIDSSCCTLHLLLIILACIATGVYAWDMKKRQARIYELEEELGEY